MVVALTPRHSPAKVIASAIAERSLIDFGSAEVIIAADSQPARTENDFIWYAGSPIFADPEPLSRFWSPKNHSLELSSYARGAFGGLAYKASQNQVNVFSDRLALMPLYVARQPNSLVVGDGLEEVISLLGEPLTASDIAWAGWLVFGHFLGPHTPFDEVLRFCPGQLWTIDLPALTVRVEYFDPLPSGPDETIGREEALVQLTELVQRAVERIANANSHLPVLVPLGAGWDSRLIAGALRRAGIPFVSVTTSRDFGNDRERVCAAKVAAHLGVPNAYYDLKPDYYLQALNRCVQATDYGSVIHVWQQSFINQLPAHKPALAFDGYAGDLLLHGFQQPASPTVSESAPNSYDHYRLKYGIEDLLATPAKSLVESLARNALQNELGPEPTPSNHLRFLLHNRNRRNIALGPVRILSQRTTVGFPFLDGKLLDFAWRLPDRLRFDPSFYPELLDQMVPGLGQISSINRPEKDSLNHPVPIHKHSAEVIAFFRRTLERHPEELGQFLDPEKLSRTFARIYRNPARYAPIEFNRLEMAAHFARWLHAHALKMRPVHLLHQRFADEMRSPEPQSSAVTQVLIPSNITTEMHRWHAFQKTHGGAKLKLPLLLTMDVEAFAPGDVYAAHTSKADPFECLVLGRFPKHESILEKLYKGHFLAPWTLFVEMGALWRFGEQRLVELVSVLRDSPHEIALHLHPFSLPKAFFDARRLEWNSYQTGEGFGRILKEVVTEFTRLWGFAPRSYRSGRFDVYDGHFQALAACGLRTDSSLYQNSPHNHSLAAHDIANRIEVTPEGILEIPVTSYFHRRGPKPELYPALLDLDFTSLPVAFELLSRAQTQSLPAVVLLAHSWSFAASYRRKGIGKVVHFAPSRAAEEKLKWIIEFCASSQLLRFATCASLGEDMAARDGTSDQFDGLIEINGDPGRCVAAATDRLITPIHPWRAIHSALTLTHVTPATLQASWQRVGKDDALYIELLGGNFLEPPPARLSGLVLLGQATEVLVTFRHKAGAPVDIVVFFMQYTAHRRVRNCNQTVRATDEPRFETLVFAREPEAATFKIAIRVVPKEHGPGWVQLDGLRLQRQS
jgi:hypothetical protein